MLRRAWPGCLTPLWRPRHLLHSCVGTCSATLSYKVVLLQFKHIMLHHKSGLRVAGGTAERSRLQ